VRNRVQLWTFQALERIKQRLPFPLLGIDSDNDGAFIKTHLINCCTDNQLTLTRSRPCRKNDGSYVEQKNKLRRTYQELNLVKLKAKMDKLKDKLWRLQRAKKKCTGFRVDSYVRQ